MALTRPYTTPDEVRREIHNSDSFEDDWIDSVINDASRWVEGYCNRTFWFYDHSSTAYTVHEDDIMDDRIFLPWPIITLTQVESDDDVIDSDTYRWNNSKMGVGTSELIRNGGCDWLLHYTSPHRTILGAQSAPPVIKLTGTFGYTYVDDDNPPSNLPQQIRRATTLIASAMSSLYSKEAVGHDGSKQSVLVTSIPPEAKKMLMKWKWNLDI